MEKTLQIAIIGLGGRAMGLLKSIIFRMKDIEVVAVCDLQMDRTTKAIDLAKKMRRMTPKAYHNYNELLPNINPHIDAVIIMTSWESHTKIALDFMNAHIPVGVEVGGAYNLEECWSLIECYRRTKTPYMMLENCCYGEYELALLNMVKKGVFGDVVHCDGGYRHDLRYEITFGEENKHYRLKEYINRNCENYPTHEIAPIAKILDINSGNRFVTLTSTSSSAKGLNRYIVDRMAKYSNLKNLKDTKFSQGDIVTTVLKCQNGETVAITLDTCNPRYYSRGLQVHGTKAYYSEDGKKFVNDHHNFKFEGIQSSAKRMVRKYRHPIWKWFKKIGVRGGHGGMDWLVFRAFFEGVREGKGVMPLDIFDSVTYMAVTALSEISIKNGSAPVEFPDFTEGKWQQKKEDNGFFSLNK